MLLLLGDIRAQDSVKIEGVLIGYQVIRISPLDTNQMSDIGKARVLKYPCLGSGILVVQIKLLNNLRDTLFVYSPVGKYKINNLELMINQSMVFDGYVNSYISELDCAYNYPTGRNVYWTEEFR